MRIEVTIEGTSSILMNRFTDESEISVTKGYRRSGKGKSATPRDQAEKTAYRDSKTGKLYIPGPNLFACLVEGGKFSKLGRNKVTTQKSSLVPAGISLDELVLPLGTKNFEVDSRRVVIPSTGGAIMRHRARLDKWSLSFSLKVDTNMFDPDLVRTIVDDAGSKIGLGDYRPARKGPFGKFKVIKWEEVAD